MKIRKILCVLLSFLSLFYIAPISSFAETSYPESAHDYENSFYGEWTYSHPQPAKGLLVTFSSDTWVEESALGGNVTFNGGSSGITLRDVISSPNWFKRGDFIAVYDGFGELIDSYSGSSLAGKTIFVAGDSFKIALVSDSSVTGYGFKVTKVRICADDEIAEVIFHSGFDDKASAHRIYYKGSEIELPDSLRDFGEDFASAEYKLLGWSENKGSKNIDYKTSEIITLCKNKLNLYPVSVKLALSPDEVFTFNNSEYNFVIDGEDRYVMSQEDFRMLQLNLYKTYGPGPFPNPVLSLALCTFPRWNWEGSCYGLAAVTALQHYGLIDLLHTQNVESMNKMELDNKLLSCINYYQANAATSYLTENKAVIANSPQYSQSLKYMFESVKAGNIVIFTFYQGAVFVTPGHSVLLTGAYTDREGRHILVAYDSNTPWEYYSEEYSSEFIISPDFDSIMYDEENIGAINWTDDFSQFSAFDINGKADTLSWYRAYFRHIKIYFERIFKLFKQLFTIRVK